MIEPENFGFFGVRQIFQTIEKPKVETKAPAETTNASTSDTTSSTTETPKKSKFVDVHEYADKIGPGGDMSGVPPGMGGSGLGA